jgi:hypothetical protein
MKKILFLVAAFSFLISACLPANLLPQPTNPASISVEDIQATMAVLAQQTLQALPTLALPTETIIPSNTPRISTATNTPIPVTPTETQNPVLLMLTATLNTGTAIPDTSLPANIPSSTPNPAITSVLVGTAHPQHYGTMPPSLPYGYVTLINLSKAEVYISLHCTTNEGYVTILEYPVRYTVKTSAPAGKYTYVAWVGSTQIVGFFRLGKAEELTLSIFKDHVVIK